MSILQNGVGQFPPGHVGATRAVRAACPHQRPAELRAARRPGSGADRVALGPIDDPGLCSAGLDSARTELVTDAGAPPPTLVRAGSLVDAFRRGVEPMLELDSQGNLVCPALRRCRADLRRQGWRLHAGLAGFAGERVLVLAALRPARRQAVRTGGSKRDHAT